MGLHATKGKISGSVEEFKFFSILLFWLTWNWNLIRIAIVKKNGLSWKQMRFQKWKKKIWVDFLWSKRAKHLSDIWWKYLITDNKNGFKNYDPLAHTVRRIPSERKWNLYLSSS